MTNNFQKMLCSTDDLDRWDAIEALADQVHLPQVAAEITKLFENKSYLVWCTVIHPFLQS